MNDIIVNIAIVILTFSYCLVVVRNKKKEKQALRFAKEISQRFRKDSIDDILNQGTEELLRNYR